MSLCTFHPDRETGATCEYCGRPFCGECLTPLLGRQYCADCYGRVQSVATGKPYSPPVQGTGEGSRAQLSKSFRLPAAPGWFSAGLYLLLLAVLLPVVNLVAQGPLLLVKYLLLLNNRVADFRDPMSISGLGMGGWVPLFALFTWGSLFLVLVFTALTARLIERRPLSELGLSWSGVRPGPLLTAGALGLLWGLAVVGISAGRGNLTLTPASDLPRFGWVALLTPLASFALVLPLAALEGVALRGYLMAAIRRFLPGRPWGEAAAVMVSALVFTAFQAQNPHFKEHPWAVVPLAAVGALLAFQTVQSGTIWPSVLTWTGWLTVQASAGLPVSVMGSPTQLFRPLVAILRASVRLPLMWSPGSAPGETATLLVLTCLLLAGSLAALHRLLEKRAEETGKTPPAPARAIPISAE